MVNEKLVSVIIPVYNAEKYISECIDSLLVQTYKNFELLILNDGSTDNTYDIIEGYSRKDERVKVYSRENKGITITLNELLMMCNSPFIMRMDADDICLPNRIAIQMEFLENNPDIGFVGCQVELINSQGLRLGRRFYPQAHKNIVTYFLYGNPICHPSVFFNKNVVGDDLFYCEGEGLRHVEDIELWLRLLNKYKGHVVNKILLKYRITSSGITSNNNDSQKNKEQELIYLFWRDNPGLNKNRTIFCKSLMKKDYILFIKSGLGLFINTFSESRTSPLYFMIVFLKGLRFLYTKNLRAKS